MYQITTFVPEKIWIIEYPIKYSGVKFNARTTLVKLDDGSILIHSPCRINDDLKKDILKLGPVGYIVAPGNFHHLFVNLAQDAFPYAKTYISEGIQKKQKDLRYNAILTDKPILDEFLQQPVLGSKIMKEVAFLHKETKTLILVDLIENIGDDTKGTNIPLRIWWFIFRMWNKAKPAPEYQLGWSNKKEAAKSLQIMLDWDFDKIILSHGDLITTNAKDTAKGAWQTILKHINK
jgi:hypothetical protein